MDNYKDDPFHVSGIAYWKKARLGKAKKKYLEAYFFYNEAIDCFHSLGCLHEDRQLRDEVKKKRKDMEDQIKVLRSILLDDQRLLEQPFEDEDDTASGSFGSESPSQTKNCCPPTKDPNQPTEIELKTILANKIIRHSPSGGVKWEDIQGSNEVKQLLQIKLVLPQLYPWYSSVDQSLTRNVLLFGPPGCGKSMFGKAVATEVNAAFLPITSSDILARYIGEGENNIRRMFEVARENSPCVIFIDEAECLFKSRELSSGSDSGLGLLAEFNSQIQGGNASINNEGITLLATSNYPWLMDEAALRRFGSKIFIDLPDPTTRANIFQYHLDGFYNLHHLLTGRDFESIAEKTKGLSGSDLANLVTEIAERRFWKASSAKYFTKVEGVSPATGLYSKHLWMPCSPSNRTATRKDFYSIPRDALILPTVTRADVDSCLEAIQACMKARNEKKEGVIPASKLQEKLKQYSDRFGTQLPKPYEWNEEEASRKKMAELKEAKIQAEKEVKELEERDAKVKKDRKFHPGRSFIYATSHFV